MKKFILLLLLICTFGTQLMWAADTPTYQYIQFSGNGRTVLLDTNGALSVVNATDDAPTGDGYQWTLEPSTTTTNAVLLKSKAGHYVTYNATAHTFGTTTDATAAATFTQSTNTYYDKLGSSNKPADNINIAGATRYDLSLTTVTTAAKALAVKNGQLTLAVMNSRYSNVRLANSVKGPAVNPLLSTDGNEHWYYIEMLCNTPTECIRYAAVGSNLTKQATPAEKFHRSYEWSLVEANEQGDVYFKSKEGHYIALNSGLTYFVSSATTNQSFRLGDVNDQTGITNAFVLYDTNDKKFLLPYGNGNTNIGVGSSYNKIEGIRFIETTSTPANHIIQFYAGGKTVLHDAGANQRAVVKVPEAKENTAAYTWAYEEAAGQTNNVNFVLKSGLGNYLKYANNRFSTTANVAEALVLTTKTDNSNDFRTTRTTFVFANDVNKTLCLSGDTLRVYTANAKGRSFYALTRVVSDTTQLSGTKAPLISFIDINNPYQFYKIQFKSNPASNSRLTLTLNANDKTATPVLSEEVNKAHSLQNWFFTPAQNVSNVEGDFYIRDEEGNYLCYDNNSNKNNALEFYVKPYTRYNANNYTIFRFIRDDQHPDYWTIIATGSRQYMGLDVNGMLKNCSATDASDLQFTPSNLIGSVVQFYVGGKTALYDNGNNSKVSVKAPTANEDSKAYEWAFVPSTENMPANTTNANKFKLVPRSGLGNYLKYDSTKQTFSTTTNASEAVALTQQTSNDNDIYTSRTRFVLANDNSKALGCKNDSLLICDKASFFASALIVNDTTQMQGTKAPQLSDADGNYYYKIQFKANPANDNRLTLTLNEKDKTAAPIVNIEAAPTSAHQNWLLTPAQHNDDKDGDFYIRDEEGNYLCFLDNKFTLKSYKDFNVSQFTAYRLLRDDKDPNCWTIIFALANPENRNLGLRAEGNYTLQQCSHTSAYTLLQFKPSEYVGEYNYLQFSGNGRTVIAADHDTVKVVETKLHQLEGDAYQWGFEAAFKEHGTTSIGIYIKNKNGGYVCYDATTKKVKLVPMRHNASVFTRTENTYYGTGITGAPRYNYTLYGNTDTYNTLGVRNGVLQLVKPNSRYAVVRRTAYLKGADFNPRLSDDQHHYYYHMVMDRNVTGELLQNNPSDQVARKTSTTILPLPAFRWSVYEANDLGDVYFKSYYGNYLYNKELPNDKTTKWDQYITTDESLKADKGRYKLCEVADQANEAYDGYWVIYNYSSSTYMQPYGLTVNNVGSTGTLMVEDRMHFADVSAKDTTYRYMLFPAMGLKALNMDNDNKLKAEVPRYIQPDNSSLHYPYLWHIKNFALQNRDGYYVTYTDEDGFGTSLDSTKAYKFEFDLSTYENNNYTRAQFFTTDKSKVLSIDNQGQLKWSDKSNTRYSVVRLSSFAVAPQLPSASAYQSNYQLYYVQTLHGNHHNYTLNDDNTTLVLKAAEKGNLRQMWVLVSDGNQTGDCYLQSTFDRKFFKYDAAANDTTLRFTTTSNKSEATHLRLVESNEEYNYWQLQVVGIEGPNNLICLDDKTHSFTLAAPNNTGNYINLIKADITPECYDEEGGAFRNLLLNELNLQLTANDQGIITVEPTTSTNTNHNSWKNVGTSTDFVLRNANGKYLYAADDNTVSLVDDEKQATHLYLHLNHSLNEGDVTWCLAKRPTDGTTEDEPTLCLGLDADGTTVKMLPFSTYKTEGKHTLCFTYSAPTSPDLTTDANSGKNFYYYVHFIKKGNYYLCDGMNDDIDIIAQNQKKVNDQMWAFVGGSKEDFLLMSKDKNYVCYEPAKKNFDITHDPTKAAHFSATYVPKNQCYIFTLVGGPNTDEVQGWQLMFSGDGKNVTLGQMSNTGLDINSFYLQFEQIDQPEDYTDYDIHSKRSWHVRQVHDAAVDPMTGFIQRDETGWTINPYTHRPMQKTSTYTITHYLKCKSTHNLYLPTCLADVSPTRSRAYQRWYNYKTDEAVNDSVVYLGLNSARKYSNGLVVGNKLNFNGGYGDYVPQYVTFQMPQHVPDDWEYILGADMSTYTDFVDYFGDNGNPPYSGEVTSSIMLPNEQDLIEPSLTSRNLFVIRNARAIANELLQCKEGSNKWYEEHTISFPKKKVTLGISTINLDMQRGDYWFYKDGTAAEDNLQNAVSYGGSIDIVVDDPLQSGITATGFISNELSSDKTHSTWRAIGFKYPGDTDGNGIGMAKANRCTIKVYGHASDGTRYQLAKFNLKFEENFEPLILDEVIGTKDDGSFKNDRSPEALRQLAGEPVATISFDPDPYDAFVTPPVGTNTSFGGDEDANTTHGLTYRYPVNYDKTSYSFAPQSGSFNSDKGGTGLNVWGTYSIVHRYQDNARANFFPVKKFYQDLYGQQRYDASQAAFCFIDASDLPGQIISLDFEGQPCSGSRLYISAWMGSPNVTSEKPANVIFHVQGIKDGKVTTLYSYCPGSIFTDARKADGTTFTPTNNGGKGIWQQVFFSFVNTSAVVYDSYQLTIDNACVSTKGGDITIDDIEVFALKPSVELKQSTPVCSQQVTLTKMAVDFDVVLQQLGMNEDEDLASGDPNLWYCLVDKAAYDTELRINAAPTDTAYVPSTTDVWRAFNKALVGNPNVTSGPERAFRHVAFTSHYTDDTKLPPFSYQKALRGTDAQRFKETQQTGTRDFIISDKMQGANLQANHDYYILFKPRFNNDPITLNNAIDAFEVGTPCAITSIFRTHSAIKVVEDANDNLDFNNEVQTCAGKSVSLSVIQQGNNNDGSQPQRITQYDWWLDYVGGAFTQVAINATNGTWRTLAKGESLGADEQSLREALLTFRHFYPTATTVVGAQPQRDNAFGLEQPVLNALHQLTQRQGNNVAPLQLLNSTCNVYVSPNIAQGDSLQVTVVPIDNVSVDGTSLFCYDPEQINIKVSGTAPQLYDGLNDNTDTYPDYLTNVPVRTSLAAVTEVTEPTTDTAPQQVLRLPLRGIRTITDGAIGLQHIITTASDHALVYLAGTNDPALNSYVEGISTVDVGEDVPTTLTIQGFRPVGVIKDMEALSADKANAHADIYFNHDFQPREGYTYTLRIDYREQFAKGSTTVPTTCDGALMVDLIIVPQYQVWTGAAGNTDWTNDANWQRADISDLHFSADAAYNSNAANGTAQGFVPMLHTNVIIGGQVAGPNLYATNNSGAEGDGFVNFVDHEGEQRTATPDIEYALLAAEQATDGVNTCSRYVPYQAKGMVMQAGSELLHPERLSYQKAWVEYALTPNRWYTLGSPLQSTYAGDWYAPTANAQQLTPYFADVTFNTTDYNRFSPAVYQRSWDKASSTLYYLSPYSADQPQQTAVAHEDAYMAATWSKVYNDVQTPYTNGGFSVKVKAQGKGAATYTQSLFRLPKEDVQYNYYTTVSATDGKTYTVDRTLNHRLLTDKLNEAGDLTLTLHNNTAANVYYLVSNPFTSGLDMNQFFTTNASALDGSKYWLLTADGQMGVMQNADDKGWTTVNANNATTAQGILAPGQGFFVKAAQATGQLTLTFTADMMTSAHTAGSALKAPARRSPFAGSLRTLRIRAERSGLHSEALIMKDEQANNDYQPTEDMEALVDNSLADVPTVYTMAGQRASTINRRRSLYRVPLGVLSNSEAPTRLTFTGMSNFAETLSLLDEQTGNITPLTLASATDSVTVEVPGNTVGRYSILSSERPTDEDMQQLTRPIIQTDGQRVSITSSPQHPLTHVVVVDVAGRTLYNMTPFTASLSIKLPTGVYVIEARTAEGKTVCKVTL